MTSNNLKTVFDIEGMTCIGCAKTVEGQLNALGCSDISVNNSLGEASAVIPADQKASAIAENLSKIGYPSKVRVSSFKKNQKNNNNS